jgi:hypothetical protein
MSHPTFVGLLFRPSAAAPAAAADLVLVGLGEEVADGCSKLQMRWCRVAGSCGGFHAFVFLDDSSERWMILVSAWRREVQRILLEDNECCK